MSESKANQCEFHLIKAWMPVSKPYIKASIESITSLKLPKVKEKPDFLYADPICRISDSRYLMCLSFIDDIFIPAIEVDINTMATKPIEDLSDSHFHIYSIC